MMNVIMVVNIIKTLMGDIFSEQYVQYVCMYAYLYLHVQDYKVCTNFFEANPWGRIVLDRAATASSTLSLLFVRPFSGSCNVQACHVPSREGT